MPKFAKHCLCALLIASVAGCATVPSPVPSDAPTRPRPGYDQRVDGFDVIDPSVLAGKRIALDPGHGGFFRGALGVNGLTESEVNLGVALYLRGLLEARGAVVFMTRTDDRDFLTPADSSLRSDLAERTRLANAFAPDLFISVHHNADPGGAHDKNEIQTYYKLGDDGPSLDLAQSVHRYLVRNLGIEKQRILPGNYFVLRNSLAPALLTESSFITNPDVEARLALAAKQRLEAEAMLLGIAHFFARRTPRIDAFYAASEAHARPDSVFEDITAPVLIARIEGPFDQAELRVDGDPVSVRRYSERLEWRAGRALPPGRHRASLIARLGGHGTSLAHSVGFEIRRPARLLQAAAWPASGSPIGGWTGIRIEALDSFGFPIADTLPVRVTSSCPCDRLRASQVALEAGVGWAYVEGASRERRPAQWREQMRIEIEPLGRGKTGPPSIRLTIPIDKEGRRKTAFLTHGIGDTALVGAPGTVEPWGTQNGVNRDGLALFPRLAEDQYGVPAVPGYRPWALETGDAKSVPTRWAAIAAGALHNRRIVLDPDGGGDDAAGIGPSGTRAANMNLEVARALAGYLEAAGAEVLLTRNGDFALSDVERVQMSETFGAHRYLRIGHRGEPPRLGHYFTSAAGKSWANRTARALERLGLPAVSVTEDAQYPLQQTSCPALYAAPARVDERADEDRLHAPGGLRAEAYALFIGLAQEWAPDADWPIDSVIVMSPRGQPIAGAIVVIGDALVLETDSNGRARFMRTEPGPLSVRVDQPGIRSESVLLDSTGGAVLGGPRAP